MVSDKFTSVFISALLANHSDTKEESILSALLAKNPKYLHVIINGDDDQMLHLAKRVALLAHFPTFYEEDYLNTCTKITILGKKSNDNWRDVFGNLCRINVTNDKVLDAWIAVPIDVQVEHVTLPDNSSIDDWARTHTDPNRVQILLTKKDIEESIDEPITLTNEQYELLAKRVNAIYDESQRFDIIRAEDIEHIHEFDTPVEQFIQLSDVQVDEAWHKENTDKESSRAMAISMFVRIEMLKCLKTNKDHSLYDTLSRHLLAMSQSEHARWNVEKLINGFRPYTRREVIADENLFGAARDVKIKELKNSCVHLDLCSYSRLRRIDLKSIKYDSFLLLAMVKYWETKMSIVLAYTK